MKSLGFAVEVEGVEEEAAAEGLAGVAVEVVVTITTSMVGDIQDKTKMALHLLKIGQEKLVVVRMQQGRPGSLNPTNLGKPETSQLPSSK